MVPIHFAYTYTRSFDKIYSCTLHIAQTPTDTQMHTYKYNCNVFLWTFSAASYFLFSLLLTLSITLNPRSFCILYQERSQFLSFAKSFVFCNGENYHKYWQNNIITLQQSLWNVLKWCENKFARSLVCLFALFYSLLLLFWKGGNNFANTLTHCAHRISAW